MSIINSPEYEYKIKYLYSTAVNRLGTPGDISISESTVLFSKVDNATRYSFYLDTDLLGSSDLSGNNASRWLFNELIDIEDDAEIVFSFTESGEYFEVNGFQYNILTIYGRDTAPGNTNKFAIYFDETKVFEEQEDSSSLWLDQKYREIHIFGELSQDLEEFLEENSESLPEQLTLDLSTLSGWSEVIDGTYSLQIIARALGYNDSFLSNPVGVSKNEEFFVKGRKYGPYLVTRVVDGDTVVANVRGTETKIRMIGVNTPESVATSGYRTENCQEGIDASNYTKAQLTNAQIYIEFDEDPYDKYNRYLCYIYRDRQGTQMYNNELIAEGYAEAEYYSPNGAHRAQLEATQATARANRVRSWGTQFFPTILEPPTVLLSGSVITWPVHPYTESYDIKFKKSSKIVYTDNYVQIIGSNENIYDIATAISEQSLGSGTFKLNLISQPTNSTHKTSKNSNTITYVAS